MADSEPNADSRDSIPSTYASKLGPQESVDEERDPETVASAIRSGDEKWSNLSADELLVAYRHVIWPLLKDDGKDPETTVPSREWLRAHGHRNLEYALRQYHDTTLTRWCREVVGVTEESSGPDWATEDEATRQQLDRWLSSQQRRDDIGSESTIETKQSRLQAYLRAYAHANGRAALLDPVEDTDDRPRAYDEVTAAYDRLDQTLSDGPSKYQYHTAIGEFYESAVVAGRAAFNPTTGLMDERYGWDSGTDESPSALEPFQIRRLYDAADTPAERLVVVALGGWGLRRGEVAALHREQLVLSDEAGDDGALIEFRERKNGPGTVALLFGEQLVADRLSALTDTWTADTAGYLFPSTRSATGHVSPTTIGNRFAALAERADVRLDSDRPSPKHCRRFWYERYTKVMGEVDEWLQAAADEQGSSSVEVLKQSYVPEERLRELRRERMREELADAFGHL